MSPRAAESTGFAGCANGGHGLPDSGACIVGVSYPWAPCHNHSGTPVAPAPESEDKDATEDGVKADPEVEDDVATTADLAPEAGVAADEPTAEPSRPAAGPPASWSHVDD